MSQLIFMLERQRNIDVFHPADLSSMMLGYIKFLQNLWVQRTDDPETGCRFSGLVLTTEPSLFGEFSHSRIQARRMFELAEQQLNEMGGRDLTARFKHGDIPHAFNFTDKIPSQQTNEKLQLSFFDTLPKINIFFFEILTAIKSPKTALSPGKVVYIQGLSGKVDNEHQLIKFPSPR